MMKKGKFSLKLKKKKEAGKPLESVENLQEEPKAEETPLVCFCGTPLQKEQIFCPVCGTSREEIIKTKYQSLCQRFSAAKSIRALRKWLKDSEELGAYENCDEMREEAANRLKQLAKKQKSVWKKIGISVGAIGVAAAAVVVIIIYVVPYASHYMKAGKAFDAGDYDTAIQEYTAAEQFLNAESKLSDVYFVYGDKLTKDGALYQAAEYYDKVGDEQQAQEKIRANADALMQGKKYFEAACAYRFLTSDDGKLKSNYAFGMDAYEKKDYESALKYFTDAGQESDAATRVKECNCLLGKQALDAKDTQTARKYLTAAGEYEGAQNLLAACDLMDAEEILSDGRINEAKAAYEKLPSDLSYNGISVAARLELLNAHPEVLNLCGQWDVTDNYIETRSVLRSSGYWSSWYEDEVIPNQQINVSCSVNADGTFTFRGDVTFYRFTEFSSIGAYCEGEYKTINFSIENVSEFPSSYWLDGTTELQWKGDYFQLEYSEKEYFSISSDYYYNSSVTYAEKVETF